MHLPAVRANGQPAFGSYVDPAHDGDAVPAGLIVLDVDGDRIAALTRFHVDALLPRFGLPATLPRD